MNTAHAAFVPRSMRLLAFVCACTLVLSAASPARAGAPLAGADAAASAVAARTDRDDDERDRSRKKPPTPDSRKRTIIVESANPAAVGLGAAGGAFAGAGLGVVATSAAAFFALGLAGPQEPPVLISTAILALGLAAATPFLAAMGGGAAVILLDPRSSKDEWSGLLQCAAAGYCLGLSLVAGTVCGTGLFCAPGMSNIPGPDRPAEWTGGAAIAGLFAGGLTGALLGWMVAPNPQAPIVPIAAGAFGGAMIGSSVSAGVGAAIATALRP